MFLRVTQALAASGETFDAVLSLEVIEHVNNPEAFVACLTQLAKLPTNGEHGGEVGGAVVLSTMSRTARAYAFAIVAAERVLGWVPPATHAFEKFLTPEEVTVLCHRAGASVQRVAGMALHPITRQWTLTADTSVNYILMATVHREQK